MAMAFEGTVGSTARRGSTRTRRGVASAALVVGLTAGSGVTAAVAPATAAPLSTQTFGIGSTTITAVGCRATIEVIGAAGAASTRPGSPPASEDGANRGGFGGRVLATVAVVPGDAIAIDVGGAPQGKNFVGDGGASGGNGAGAGGASSRVVVTPQDSATPGTTLIAAGGGGAGVDAGGIAPGGDGGPAGNPGGGANAGGGASRTVGGAAGLMPGGPGDLPTAGTSGRGGSGGNAPNSQLGISRGGGGGGYLGGGGGGAEDSVTTRTSGGGGGGVNFVPVSATTLVDGTATTPDPSVSVTFGGCPTSPKTSATPLDGSARLTLGSLQDNGSPVTGFEYRVDGGAWAPLDVVAGTAEVRGLTNGVNHTVDVRARNANGPGEIGSATVTPVAVPSAPQNLSAAVVPNTPGSADLAFDGPASGNPTAYEFSADGGADWRPLTTAAGSATSFVATVSGLANGTSTGVLVRGVNASGAGATAATTVVLASGPPSAPASALANSVSAAIDLVVTPGADGGSPITGYEYELDGSGSWSPLPTAVSGSVRTASIGGLVNGTAYAVAVRAVNSNGAGPDRSAGTITPDVRPTAPTVVATRGDTSISLSITPPTGYGGTAVSGYSVSLDDGTTWSALPTSGSAGARTATVTGLTNGRGYPVRVRAENAGGPGNSSVVSTVVPARTPVLTGVSSVGRDSSARISFTVADGGSPVTGYATQVDNLGWVGATPTFTAPGVGYVDIPGLTNGTTPSVSLRVGNAVGPTTTGPTQVSPYRVVAPAAPTAVPGESSILASWPAAASVTNVVGYRATAVTGGGSCTTSSATIRSCVLGAVAGVGDRVTVVAIGANGVDSLPSSPSPVAEADPPTVPVSLPPTVPTTLTAVGNPTQPAIGEQVVVEGTGFAPFSTASIAIYSTATNLATVTTNAQGNFSQPVTVPSSLTPGGHTFFAAGVTPTGTTRQMALPVQVTPAPAVGVGGSSVPAAPQGVVLVPGNTAIGVRFRPAAPGSSAVTGYQASTDGGRTWTAVATATGPAGVLQAELRGLANGTSYPVTVRAISAVGAGAPSVVVSATPVAPTLVRVGGSSRIGTAVAAARQVFPVAQQAGAAVVATSATFADSVGGARLAAQVDGPLLLTGTAALDAEVAAEIRRLVRTGGTVYVLGSTTAVSDGVSRQLADLDSSYDVQRLGGENRFQTAVRTAEEVRSDGDTGPIYLVSGTDYPDGLTVSALAAATGGVVVLTAGTVVPAATAEFLRRVDPQGSRTIPVGGSAAAAARTLPSPASTNSARAAIVGTDRYDTSRLLAQRFPGTVSSVGLASGAAWPDALVGAAAMGVLRGPLVLTRTDTLSPAARTAVLGATGAGARSGVAFGGVASLTGAPVEDFTRLLEGD